MLGVVGMVVSVGRMVGAVVALVAGTVGFVVLGVVSVATFFRQPVNRLATSRALIRGNNTFFIFYLLKSWVSRAIICLFVGFTLEITAMKESVGICYFGLIFLSTACIIKRAIHLRRTLS